MHVLNSVSKNVCGFSSDFRLADRLSLKENEIARITSSEMPEPTMAITSWFVSLRLIPEPSSQNADERRRKPKTNTRTTDPIRLSLIKLITEAPHLKLLQSNGPAEKRVSGGLS
ncbi:MAG: hypothetical protein DMG63_19630 [Acidobacteria bacterium]|nr:MAG: hypothetical protein DMG63_19630 [Acidobacteriota bacterium]